MPCFTTFFCRRIACASGT
jgi:hypothetical protein